jgi:hypothetical protein
MKEKAIAIIIWLTIYFFAMVGASKFLDWLI